jgi:hypothetical protein
MNGTIMKPTRFSSPAGVKEVRIRAQFNTGMLGTRRLNGDETRWRKALRFHGDY